MQNDYKEYVADKQFQALKREFFAKVPEDVDGVFNSSTLFWRDYLYRLLFGVFDFEGIEENWDKGYMLTSLFQHGMFCITDTEMGVLPLICGIWGHNVFHRPSKVNIANHVLGSFTRTIDVDCALIHLQYNYTGIDRLIQRTATMLAMCDSSIAVNLMNSKVAFIGFADNKAEATTMQKMYDTISAGKPAVFVRKQQVSKNDIYYNHVKNNFVADLVQDSQRTIIDQFLNAIGIANSNSDKKERLIVDEVTSNNSEVEASAEHWLETVNRELEKANKMYSLNLKFIRKKFIGSSVWTQEIGAPTTNEVATSRLTQRGGSYEAGNNPK